MTKIAYERDPQTVCEDGLFPGGGLGDPGEAVRCAAIIEVLRRIPEPDYSKLRALADDFYWFIPDKETRAGVYPLPVTVQDAVGPGGAKLRPYCRALYLSPTMEQAAFDIAVAIVAHELAHIVLGHGLFTLPDQYQSQEDEAFDRICSWGFGREARKHRAVNRGRETKTECR